MCTNDAIAIDCDPWNGPIFGSGGLDFCIACCSNSNKNSESEFGNSYKHPDYPLKANSILAGSLKFQTLEIEVFTQIN